MTDQHFEAVRKLSVRFTVGHDAQSQSIFQTFVSENVKTKDRAAEQDIDGIS